MLLDTGPLVGYLNGQDQHHRWAVQCWSALFEPLWTCESVLSEAVFALQSEGLSTEPLLRLVERGLVRVEFNLAEHRADILRLLRKYADQPMSLADACLVRMAECHPHCQILTTDRDFLVYRRHGRQVIPVLSPFGE
ncbi:MAG: type II toxin-antitoxin system VapC family toxin [Limisphaerales bacterium]